MTDDGVRGFVVPTDTPGFVANDIHRKLSLRASVTSELVLTDVRLPASARAARAWPGMRGPLSCLSEARFGIVCGAVGAARACYEAALAYTKERQQFDRPMAGFQLIQRKLVEMMVQVNRAGLLGPAPRPPEGPGGDHARPRSASASWTTCARPSTWPARPVSCSAPTASPSSTR